MFAELIAQSHGGKPEKYYTHLIAFATDDTGITTQAQELLRDRAKAWDVLMGI